MALVNFIRQGVTTVAQTINFSVGGTATFNTDYTVNFPVGITGTWGASSGSVTIPIGSGQVDVTLAVTGDSVTESDETVLIAITSVSPVIGISPSNPSCLLIIKNDDFFAYSKAIGVTLNATALVGSFSGATCFIASNTGSAPVNWSNWLIGSPSAFTSVYSLNSPVSPFAASSLSKIVARSPSIAPVDTTTIHAFTVTRLIALGFRGNASGSWDLVYGKVGVAEFLGTILINAGISTWLDIITEYSSINTTFSVNGLITIITGTLSATSAGTEFYFRNSAGFAAFTHETGRVYSPTMFPITAVNL